MQVEVTQFPWLRCKYEDLGARCDTAPPSWLSSLLKSRPVPQDSRGNSCYVCDNYLD